MNTDEMRKIVSVWNLYQQGATEGERSAAYAALGRLTTRFGISIVEVEHMFGTPKPEVKVYRFVYRDEC